MKLNGRAFVFGDDVNTDAIVPARYLVTTDPMELAVHCMEEARPGFASTVKAGSILVAGRNFGCGSSREHAPLAIKALGISCVIAESFARIFFRNAINIGLPIVESAGIAMRVMEGEEISIDLNLGEINLASGERIAVSPYPPFMEAIVREGGWMKYLLSTQARSGEGL
jgi:3-isopropylmalate/(R)-2-methylmalate dehydratase small subunit